VEGQQADFPSITSEKCFNGMGKLAIDFECKLWEIEENLRGDYIKILFSLSNTVIISSLLKET